MAMDEATSTKIVAGSTERLPLLRRINLKGLIFPLVVIVGLEFLIIATGFQRDSVARPSEIALRLLGAMADGSIFLLTSETLAAAIGGVLIGSAIGLTLGVMFGAFPPSFSALELTTEVIRPIPSVSLIPVALLVLGFGYTMEVSLIAKSTIWPVMILTHAAISGLHPRHREVTALLQLNFFSRITKVVLPSIMPSVFVGFRLSMGVALLVAITIEIVVNPRGLGHAMMVAEETLNGDLMFALLVWIGIIGVVINWGLLWLQRKLFPRSPSAGADA